MKLRVLLRLASLLLLAIADPRARAEALGPFQFRWDGAQRVEAVTYSLYGYGEPMTLFRVTSLDHPAGSPVEREQVKMGDRLRRAAYRFYYDVLCQGYEPDPKGIIGVLEFSSRGAAGDYTLPYERMLGLAPRTPELKAVTDYPVFRRPRRNRLSGMDVGVSEGTQLVGTDMEINKLAISDRSYLYKLGIASGLVYLAEMAQLDPKLPTSAAPASLPLSPAAIPEQYLAAHPGERGESRFPVRPSLYRITCANNPALIRYYRRKHGFELVTDLPFQDLSALPEAERKRIEYWRRTTVVMQKARARWVEDIAADFRADERGMASELRYAERTYKRPLSWIREAFKRAFSTAGTAAEREAAFRSWNKRNFRVESERLNDTKIPTRLKGYAK